MTTVDPRAELGTAPASSSGSGPMFILGQYVALMKPRIIETLLVTTLPVMFLAQRGVPSWSLVVITLIAGTLSAGSANAFNCYLDRDIDAVMHRTSKRPLVTGTISPRSALIFASALGIVSTLLFGLLVNWLSAGLSVAALLFYVLVYTMFLKRRTAQNIVWGGAAGCTQVLIGWAAVRNEIAWPGIVLFLVIFFWTPPHYWPLSMKFKEDYAAARVPMLPVVEGNTVVARQIVLYSWAMVLVSLSLIPVARMGWFYTVVSVLIGGVFLAEAHRLQAAAKAGEPESVMKPMRLFHWSISYITFLFLAVAVDPLWHMALPGLGS